jgi:hypothetical protein
MQRRKQSLLQGWYNPGVYTDTNASSKRNRFKLLRRFRRLGEYTVLSTSAHFQQKARLPEGKYLLSVTAHTVITKGNGAFVDVLCANPSCGDKYKENDSLGKIVLPQGSGFETKTIDINVPKEGNNKDYRIRVVAGEGSELYVDRVSLTGGGKEYVLNGEFKSVATSPNSIALDQPQVWGEASNKLGYFYGMAINNNLPPVGNREAADHHLPQGAVHHPPEEADPHPYPDHRQ